jgi:hypothetical protein
MAKKIKRFKAKNKTLSSKCKRILS